LDKLRAIQEEQKQLLGEAIQDKQLAVRR